MSGTCDHQRWRLRARGVVQGVGFRPWCVQTAAQLGLAGWVRNDPHGVLAEVQGTPRALAAFAAAWRDCPLPLSRVTQVEQHSVPVEPQAVRPLVILPSEGDRAAGTR